MKKLGFIVNPVAGIGGKVGLKGSDGAETLAKAMALGAQPEAGNKALITMKVIKEHEDEFDIYTWPGEMGEDICKEAGLKCTVVGEIHSGHTTPEDTIKAAQQMKDLDLDLILFAGGDGTARNIMDAVGTDIPVLGIPAGCKIHSGVYAVNPRTAGELMVEYGQGRISKTREAEVMDIDEDLFRQGIVEARLYGYLQIPNERKLVQNLKGGGGYNEEDSINDVAEYFADLMEEDTLYIMGTGSTIAVLMKYLELPNTLLGVDLVYNKQVIASDCTEAQVLEALGKYPKAKIVVTVIGGQGYVFGRGNQQISAKVIRRVGKDNIMIVAAKHKIMALLTSPLFVDTGDEEVNKMLTGYANVIVGYEEMIMMRVSD